MLSKQAFGQSLAKTLLCGTIRAGNRVPQLSQGGSGLPSLGSCCCPCAPGCWELSRQGTDTAGMQGTRVGRPEGSFFYLLCYSVLSPGEEIRLPPQEAEEGVHELGNGERVERKGAVSPGHSEAPGVAGAAFSSVPPVRGCASIALMSHSLPEESTGAPGSPAGTRGVGVVCMKKGSRLFSARTPGCYPRQEWIYTRIHTYIPYFIYHIFLLCTPKSMQTPYFYSCQGSQTNEAAPLETHILLELGRSLLPRDPVPWGGVSLRGFATTRGAATGPFLKDYL